MFQHRIWLKYYTLYIKLVHSDIQNTLKIFCNLQRFFSQTTFSSVTSKSSTYRKLRKKVETILNLTQSNYIYFFTFDSSLIKIKLKVKPSSGDHGDRNRDKPYFLIL